MRHPRFWEACAFSGAVVLGACAVPLARLGLRGGDLKAHETVRVISVGTAGALAVMAGGLALLGVGVAGLRFGTHGPAVLVAFVAALVVAAQGEAGFAFSTEDGGILCTAYQASRGIGCGGRFFGYRTVRPRIGNRAVAAIVVAVLSGLLACSRSCISPSRTTRGRCRGIRSN